MIPASATYRILKSLLRLAAQSYYRKMEVTGLENIPLDRPVLFAPPHQNAMMDGVVVVVNQPRNPFFLTRADAFNNRLLGRLLRAIRFVPVFRQRDGVDTIKRNEPIFEQSADILQRNGSFLIFPEADMERRKHLRPLRKGLARIGFRAEVATGFELGVAIVPVGIDYSYYSRARSDVMVSFGQPIDLRDYRDLYREHPNRALRKVVETLSVRLSDLMIDLGEPAGHDEELLFLTKLFYTKENLRDDIQRARKALSVAEQLKQQQPTRFEQLLAALRTYRQSLAEQRLKDWLVKTYPLATAKIGFEYVNLALLSPLWLLGEAINFFPNRLPFLVIPRLLTPPFWSSGIFLLSFFVFPLFYALQIYLIYYLTDSALLAFAALFLMPALGFFAVKFRERWRRNVFLSRVKRLQKRRPEILVALRKQRRHILALLEGDPEAD